MGTFVWNNKFAIAAGAVVVAGGLWLWEQLMKLRAQKIMSEEMATANATSQKLDKRCSALGQELVRDRSKDTAVLD